MIYENFIRSPLSFSDLCHLSPLLLAIETQVENTKAYRFLVCSAFVCSLFANSCLCLKPYDLWPYFSVRILQHGHASYFSTLVKLGSSVFRQSAV